MGLGEFINSGDIDSVSRATAGEWIHIVCTGIITDHALFLFQLVLYIISCVSISVN